MSAIPHFARYAAAFEKAFESDDWSGVEPWFTEDAVYEVELPAPFGGRFEGRPAILAYFKQVLDGFDRRFARREVALLEGPRESDDGSVWIRGSARYTAPDVPELCFELEETAWFDRARIRRLRDAYAGEELERVQAWLGRHGPKLGIAP
jgi:hypothetical protein